MAKRIDIIAETTASILGDCKRACKGIELTDEEGLYDVVHQVLYKRLCSLRTDLQRIKRKSTKEAKLFKEVTERGKELERLNGITKKHKQFITEGTYESLREVLDKYEDRCNENHSASKRKRKGK